MNSYGKARVLRIFLTRSAAICVALLIIALQSVTPASALPDSVPSRLEGLKTGAQIEEVTKRLQGESQVTTDPVGTTKKQRGPRLTWMPADSPYYDKVVFEFTEKGRLFIIRFALKPAARERFGALKDDFFAKYEFSTEDPSRMRPGGVDMVLYSPIRGQELFFVEFTNIKTGEKLYELFNRQVSSEDRPEPVKNDVEQAPTSESPVTTDQKPVTPPGPPATAEPAAQPEPKKSSSVGPSGQEKTQERARPQEPAVEATPPPLRPVVGADQK